MCNIKSQRGDDWTCHDTRDPRHTWKNSVKTPCDFFMLVYIRNSLNIVRRWNSNLSRCELSTTQWGQRPFWIRFLNSIYSWSWFYFRAKIIRGRSLISLIKPILCWFKCFIQIVHLKLFCQFCKSKQKQLVQNTYINKDPTVIEETMDLYRILFPNVLIYFMAVFCHLAQLCSGALRARGRKISLRCHPPRTRGKI